MRGQWLVVSIAVSALFISARAETRQPIDTDRSTITIRVGRSGMFRALGDDHEIRASIARGFVDEDARAVEAIVDARQLKVIDPGASASDRAQVQARMLGPDVLDASRFSQIRFTSNTAERTQSGWLVRGELTLHGQTRQVMATIISQEGHYRGSARLKQTDFGITPIAIAGGAVRVKNEVTVDFDIVTLFGRATER